MKHVKHLPSENGITEGVIWKQLLIFFFPILFGTFFQQLYNTADAIIVGRFVGKGALAAVGATGTLINLLVGFFVGLSSGATVIISQYFGAKKEEDLSNAVHTAIALSFVSGAIIMAIGLPISPLVLRLLGTPADIMKDALLYTRMYFIGIIGVLIYNIGSGILRAIGDSKHPLYFLIFCCIANIAFDSLFVAVFQLGVFGVAFATLLAQLLSAALVVFTLMRTKAAYRLSLRKIRFTSYILRNIIRIGLPAGLQSVLYSLSNLLIQANINSFGTDTVAAWTAYGKIDGVFWMIINAFGISITTFVGQNFGAAKFDRMKKSVRICLSMAIGASILLSMFVYASCGFLLKIFTNDTSVMEIGVPMIRFLAPFYITYVCIEILSGAVRGAGDSLIPTIITAVGVCGLRVVWILAFVPLHPTVNMVSASYPITWSITSLAFLVYYLHGGWLKRRQKAMGFLPSDN